MTARKPSSQLAALLGGALIGGLVGAASAIVVGSTRAVEAPAVDTGDLEGELSALRGALEGAIAALAEMQERAATSELAPPAALPREPVGPSLDAEALLAALDERLGRLEVAAGRAPELSELSTVRRGRPDFPPPEAESHEAFRERHLLWDYARIVERYGLPDLIQTGGDERYWYYTDDSGHDARFTFADGLVIHAQNH